MMPKELILDTATLVTVAIAVVGLLGGIVSLLYKGMCSRFDRVEDAIKSSVGIDVCEARHNGLQREIEMGFAPVKDALEKLEARSDQSGTWQALANLRAQVTALEAKLD